MKLITSQGGRLLTLGEALGEGPAVVATSSDVPSFRTGLPALDGLAPGGALRRGAVHEILSGPSDGTPLFFAMLLARAACGAGFQPASRGRHCTTTIWCDPGRSLYPPALAAHGIDLDRLLLLKPNSDAELTWAVGECLKCRGVGAVVAEVKPRHHLSRLEARRLQLSAERGGGVGILLRPAGKVSAEHAAATRWLVRPAPGERTVQRWAVQLIHGPGGRVGGVVILEHSRETNRVRAAEKLADRGRRTPVGVETA
jgi:protein ImuA